VSFLRVPVLENPVTFRKVIVAPTSSNSATRFRNLQTLLQTLCIRRTREILGIPEPVPRLRLLSFSALERLQYNGLYARYKKEIDMVVSGRRAKRLSSTVLRSILELRLFCNNGEKEVIRQLRPTGPPEDDDEAVSYLQHQNENFCANCSNPIYSISQHRDAHGGVLMQSCTHLVCHTCLPQCYKKEGQCPFCRRGDIPLAVLATEDTGSKLLGGGHSCAPRVQGQYPTKLLALLSDIQSEPNRKR